MADVDYKGYISIHRKIEDHWLWLSEPMTKAQAWIDLLLLANHKDNSFFLRGIKIDVKRGQLAWSEERLSSRWKWSRGKLRNFLKMLETEQQIIQHRSNKIGIVEILNYDFYQKQDNKKTTKRQQNIQQKDINNNDNNENNENKFTPPTLQEVKNYFIEKGYQDDPTAYFDYYDANNWKDRDDKQIKNWKQKAITWHGRGKTKLDLLPASIIQLNKIVGDVAIKDVKDYGEDIDLICFAGKSSIVKNLADDKKQEIKKLLNNKKISIA